MYPALNSHAAGGGAEPTYETGRRLRRAEKLKRLVQKARDQRRTGRPAGGQTPIPLARPRGELQGLVENAYPKLTLASMILPDDGRIDSGTSLTDAPEAVWAYKLGNRTAIEWVLDQHKERKLKDPTIAALFNTYRFSDFKEQVVDLLGRVARVSVETVRITEQMMAVKR